MFLQKIAFACIVLCCIVVSVDAQEHALSKINKEDLTEYLTFISSDDLQGRKLGTKVNGLGITADYLAENAKRIGLKPGATNYFQKVEMLLNKPNESSIVLTDDEGELLFQSSSLITLSKVNESKNISSESIIILGFADAEIPDVKGKVVVLAQGNAEAYKKGRSIHWNSRLERSKIAAISEKKPEAIIIVANPKDVESKTFKQISGRYSREKYILKQTVSNDEVLVLLSQADFADKLFGPKGSFKNYLNKISKGKSFGFKLIENKKLEIQITYKAEAVDAKNVIGIVEGSDSKLKDEYIVFVAHYDHLGVGTNGDVYNGADDNGSGTVAILEVAEAFASLDKKPKRSIVFLWVTCEEIGLLGSTYYCNNPIYPLEKTVAVINLDMVGRVYESPRDDVWKDSPKKVKDFDGLYTLTNDVWPQLPKINEAKCKELGIVPDTSLPKARFLRASDHYPFHKKGVPILNFATGYHADYHKVGDEVEKINFDKIKRVADLCFLVGMEVANFEEIEF